MPRLAVNLRVMDHSPYAEQPVAVRFPSGVQTDDDAGYAPVTLHARTDMDGVAAFDLPATNDLTPITGERLPYIFVLGAREYPFVMPDADADWHVLARQTPSPDPLETLPERIAAVAQPLIDAEAQAREDADRQVVEYVDAGDRLLRGELPRPPRTLQSAVAAQGTNGVRTITLPQTYTDWATLLLTTFESDSGEMANAVIPTASLSAQTTLEEITIAGNPPANSAAAVDWRPAERTLTTEAAVTRIIYAALV